MNTPPAAPAKKQKSTARRVLGWIAKAVLLIFVLLAATFAYYRLRGPTAEQQAAMELMRKSYRPAQGVNAFPLLLRYDLPVEQLAAQMTADAEKVRKRRDAMDDSNENVTDTPLLPEFSDAEEAALCNIWDEKNCLTWMAAHADAARPILAAHSVMVGRAQALERADFNLRPNDSDYYAGGLNHLVLNNGVAQTLWLNAFALKYVDGDRAGALAATCRNLAAWRRMGRNAHSVSSAQDARWNAVNAIRLYATMLADLPPDAAVPEDCALALQPVVAADVDECAQMTGRFADEERMFRDLEQRSPDASWHQILFRKAMFDMPQFLAWNAQYLATACKSDTVARQLADELPQREKSRRFFSGAISIPPGVKGPECVANFGGCFLAEDCMTSMCGCALLCRSPPMQNHDAGVLDYAAYLRLAATLLWLREHPEGSIEERFARRPAQLRSPHHASGFDAANGVLYVENLPQEPWLMSSPDDEKRFELPVAVPR